MDKLVEFQFNDKELERLAREELRKRLDTLERRRVFWDLNELQEQTCMSKSAILNQFFYDERFAKIRFKIGQKWYMLAKETEEFLIIWAKEQMR